MQRELNCTGTPGQLEHVRKLSQQAATVDTTPTPLQQQQAEKTKDKTQLQSEVAYLFEQLEEARRKINTQGQVATAVQRRFKDCLGQIEVGALEQVQATEDRNRRLTARNAELLEQLRVERTERGSTLSCLQRALAETQRDLASCEVALDVRDVTNAGNQRAQGPVGWLEGRLRDGEEENAQLRQGLRGVRFSRFNQDDEATTSPKPSPAAESRVPNVEETATILKLMESMPLLQADNTALGAMLKRQTGKMAEAAPATAAGLELALKAQLERAEAENALLRRRSEEAQSMSADRERQLADVRKCFGEAFAKIRTEVGKMAASNQQLQDLLEVERSAREQERSGMESCMLQLQQELATAKQEVLLSKEALQEGSTESYQKLEQERLEREQERSGMESCMLQLQQELATAKQEVLLSKEALQEGSTESYQKLEQERLEREQERSGMESFMLQLEQELAEAKRELLSKEASQDANTDRNGELEEENEEMRRYVGRLEGMLMESEAKCVQAELQIAKLIDTLREKEREVCAAAQKLQEVFEASVGMDETIQLLQESVQRLESDTSRQEEVASQHVSRIAELEKEINEVAKVKRDLEERLNWEMQTQVELGETAAALQVERRKFSDAQELQQDLQAQLEQVQRERLMLQQQLKDSQQRTEPKDQALEDMQDFLSGSQSFQSFSEKVQLMEERSSDTVAPESAASQDLADRTDMSQDSTLEQLQKKLVDMQTKLSSCEQLLEEKTLCCKDLAMKNQVDLARLQKMLLQSEERLIQSENSNFCLKCGFTKSEYSNVCLNCAPEVDKEVATFPQKTDEVASVSTEAAESLRQLESANARLEESLRQQAGRIKELEEEVDEAARVKGDLEERLNQEIQRQSSLFINTQVEASDTEVTRQDELQKFSKAAKQDQGLWAPLESMKIDRLVLQQQLREAQKISELRDLAMMDMQRCMNDTLEGMQVHTRERIDLAERKSRVLAYEVAQLQDQLERVKEDSDSTLSQLQKELADARQELSLREKLLKERPLRSRDMEGRLVTQESLASLKEVLQQTDDKSIRRVQSDNYNFNPRSVLEDKEPEVVAFSQKLRELASTSRDTDKTMQVASVQLLVSENLRLEEVLKEHAGRIAELEKEVDEAVRAKRDLEERLGQDTERQSSTSVKAQLQVSDIEADLQDMGRNFSEAGKPPEEEQVQRGQLFVQQLAEELQEMAVPKDLLSGKQAYSKETQSMERRGQVFLSKVGELQEQREPVKTDDGSIVPQLQKELAEVQQKLSLCMESLREKTLQCSDLEEEKLLIREDLKTLREVLQQTDDRYFQLERENFNLRRALEDEERDDTGFAEFRGSKTAGTESQPRKLQKEMADVQDKLSSCEESLELKTRSCGELEAENANVKDDMKMLRGILQQAEEKYLQSEQYNFSLKSALGDKEREVTALTQKLQDVASAPTDLEKAVTSRDGPLHRLRSEKADRDVQMKLSLCEEMLEEATRRGRDLEEEKLDLQKDVDALRRQLQESEERQVQLERCIFELEGALDARGGPTVSRRLGGLLEAEEASATREGFEDQSLMEALQVQGKSKAVPLYRTLEAVEESEEVGEQVSGGLQYPFSSTLANASTDNGWRSQPMEKVGIQDVGLQQSLGREIPVREQGITQLPGELAGALELLEMKTRKCKNLEEQVDMLKKMLEASKRQNVRLEQTVQDLRSALDNAEQTVISTSLKLHQAVTASSAAGKTVAQLQENVRRLEAENGELKAKAGRQVDGAVGAQPGAGVRAKTERSQVEDRVNREVQRQPSQARRENLYTRPENDKALALMKAKMGRLSPELREDVGRSWSLEEENRTPGKPSDGFKQTRSRREPEEGVRRGRREPDEEAGRGRSVEAESTTLQMPFYSRSESFKQLTGRSQQERRMAASKWTSPIQRFS